MPAARRRPLPAAPIAAAPPPATHCAVPTAVVSEIQPIPIRAPAERWRHGTRAVVALDDGTEVEAAVDGLPLERLLHRGQLSPEAYHEGCALRALWTASGMGQRLVQRYDDVHGGGPREMTDAEDEAYGALHRHLRIAGKRAARALVDVCCLQLLPPAADLPALREGLAALVAHFHAGARPARRL